MVSRRMTVTEAIEVLNCELKMVREEIAANQICKETLQLEDAYELAIIALKSVEKKQEAARIRRIKAEPSRGKRHPIKVVTCPICGNQKLARNVYSGSDWYCHNCGERFLGKEKPEIVMPAIAEDIKHD